MSKVFLYSNRGVPFFRVQFDSITLSNRASRDGGGIYTASFDQGPDNVSLIHTTVSGNIAGRSGGAWPGEGNIMAGPLLRGAVQAGQAPTTEGDYCLSPGSPSIDRAEPGSTGRDLAGSSRPQGRDNDMGALEAEAAPMEP